MVVCLSCSLVPEGILDSLSETGGHESGAVLKDVSLIVHGSECRDANLRSYHSAVSDTVISFRGLTVVQVSQNQAAVVSDPQVRILVSCERYTHQCTTQNRIFVIKNSGFVAYAVEGSYDVLAIVDQTHLATPWKDTTTGATLGWSVSREFPTHPLSESVCVIGRMKS